MVSSSSHSTYRFSKSFSNVVWSVCTCVTVLLKFLRLNIFVSFVGQTKAKNFLLYINFQIHNRCKVRLEALTLMFLGGI